jgi:hypothetical protein
MNTDRVVVVLALSVFLGLGSAQADPPIVYELSVVPGAKKALVSGSQTLNITIDMGTDPGSGTPCVNGDGDQLCGADVLLTLTGDGQIDFFGAGSNVIAEPPSLSVLHLNILKTTPPLFLLGPQNLGTLDITVLGTETTGNQVKIVVRGDAVNAAGNIVEIPEKTIAVPEPSVRLLLLSGAFGLAALHGMRTRRATAAVRSGSQSPK